MRGLRRFRPIFLCMMMFLGLADPAAVLAREPGWSGVILARGGYRERLWSTAIQYRPYRPLHFYGNMVRRQYYRGTPLPTAADLSQAFYQLSKGEWLAGTPSR